MTRTPVKSGTIKAVGYDPATKRMQVEFNSGGVYEYSGIESHEHGALIAARSIGSHFHKHVRAKGGKKL